MIQNKDGSQSLELEDGLQAVRTGLSWLETSIEKVKYDLLVKEIELRKRERIIRLLNRRLWVRYRS